MHSIGMTRSESASSAATDTSQRSSHGDGVRHATEDRARTRPGAHTPHLTHRPKSATGLSRGAKHSKSSDRITPGGRPAPRHNLLTGLAMTRAAPGGAQGGPARKTAPSANTATTLMPPPPPPTAAKKAPVKFTMGGDESDSDDYEDEDDDEDASDSQQPVNNAQLSKRDAEPASAETVDDDGWASDSEDEGQARKERLAKDVERRKFEEEHRHRTMFQKQPIRSKSAVDLKLIAPSQSTSIGPSPPEKPVRGLLSSLFHPDEQHSPPGQLAGRPHASAADLRSSHSTFSSNGPRSPPPARRERKHRDSADSGTGVSSFRDGAGFAGFAGLRTSKSAVALPLLDTHATKSSTAGRTKQDTAIVSTKITNAHSEGSGSSPDSSAAGGRPSSVALARLQALNNMKMHAQRGSDSHETRRHLSETDSQLQNHVRSLRLEVSPDDRDFDAHNLTHATNQNRLSAPSLSTRHSDQFQQSSKGREELGSTSRSNSEGLPAGHVSPRRGSISSSPGPVAIVRPRSSADLPDAAAPQTPRTTRRNMLRDELSESLRQNLLWERQSRSRMMGIGAPAPPVQQTAAKGYRRDNVLNGNALRPLTSTGTHATRHKGEGKAERHIEEWGSFHHKGW